MQEETTLDPVEHITVDAIGAPGRRVFYLQAWKGSRTITLLIEKFQIQTMAAGFDNYLKELSERFPGLSEPSDEFDESKMRIQPPVDPLFRVGELGLSYDPERDVIELVIREMLVGEKKPEEADEVHLVCTRSQVRALCKWGLEVVNRGRPVCPYCAEPMDPEGHFCPKKNGRNK